MTRRLTRLSMWIAVLTSGCASEPPAMPAPPPERSALPSSAAASAAASNSAAADVAPPSSTTAPRSAVLPSGYPYSRLLSTENPLEALAFEIPKSELDAWSVRSVHTASATAPRVWLFVLEFADQATLLRALPKIEAYFERTPPPYAVKSSYTGAHLLVTGFPSEKPVSPEMEYARADFISAFAGRE
ncbi:MAG: hypothetical protein U0414_18175 [Polyangiaceae bacterium]